MCVCVCVRACVRARAITYLCEGESERSHEDRPGNQSRIYIFSTKEQEATKDRANVKQGVMKAAINCSDRSPFLRSYNRTVSDPCAGRPLSWSPAVANDGQCVPWSVRGRRRSAPDSHKRLLGRGGPFHPWVLVTAFIWVSGVADKRCSNLELFPREIRVVFPWGSPEDPCTHSPPSTTE